MLCVESDDSGPKNMECISIAVVLISLQVCINTLLLSHTSIWLRLWQSALKLDLDLWWQQMPYHCLKYSRYLAHSCHVLCTISVCVCVVLLLLARMNDL